ncbi:MAG: ATP-binding cassette domain-containing protein [Candidatus Hadarchaeum sp.]
MEKANLKAPENLTKGAPIIEVKGLTKVFDNGVRAVDGISFSVEEGEILGFLGPNGAGKTTTLNMLATLLRPTSGTATVNGYDILKEPDGVRRSIGFVFQDPTLDNELTGRENLDFHGRVYGLKRDVRQQRIKEVLEVVQLTDRADDLVKTYSGGMKRRLEIARGLLHYPKVLFLDEPTLGLDPQTRRAIWEHIQRLNQDENVTIILTTHYTEEADYLCDRIQIIDFGKIVALDTPENLKARLEGDIVSLVFKDSEAIMKIRPLLEEKDWIRRVDTVTGDSNQAVVSHMMQIMRGMPGGGSIGGTMPNMPPEGIMPGMRLNNLVRGGKIPKQVQRMLVQGMAGEDGQLGHHEGPKRLNLLVDNGGHRIPEIVKLVDGSGVTLESVELHKPTLDDVFLSVTGRNIRDERGSFMETIRRHRIIQEARGRRVRGRF